jgi:hypothetical protein
MERMKTENERLKLKAESEGTAGAGTGMELSARHTTAAFDKKLREQRGRITLLEKELEDCNRKLEVSRDLGQRLAQRQQQVIFLTCVKCVCEAIRRYRCVQIASLKRQLKAKEHQVQDEQQKHRASEARLQALTDDIVSAHARIRDLEDVRLESNSLIRRDEELVLLKTEIEEQRRAMEALRASRRAEESHDTQVK